MADKPTSPTAVQPSSPFVGQMVVMSSPTHPSPPRVMDKTSITSIAPSKDSGIKKPLDISNLMSPPEAPRFDSFSQRRDSKSVGPVVSDMRRMGPIPPLSPPISPATKVDDHPVHGVPSANTPVKDPILYPTQDVTSSPQQRPLFGREEPIGVRRIVDEHVNARPANLFREATPPNREDYELVLFFSSKVMELYSKDPTAWRKREHDQLIKDRQARARNHPKLQPILPAKAPQVRKETQRTRVPKPAKVVKASQSQSAAPRPIRSYPTTGAGQSSNRRVPSATPDPSPRRAVAPNREDKDFASLPNFCPPLDTLPHKANSLKVDWKGTPIDLSNDPHRNLLHPDEVTLAANLRLDCATYLTSKRRMFVRRLECLNVGKEFRKTDAQQACKIDVNKASKLWTAFDKVGWLEKRWMAPYI
ncbi:hypothetical protein F4820DRAFT_48861 [Hypoxylon rubiginosum]|uniref:Uncharacterized protein n=1 Tax=Hypoxylon rubiginosum TaxID=110542 RepID=A0ACB9YRQ5_9PEZI|nr:hypothetical protein F4820DRAFT_48861 [Hypoxylon rubiginosum]